MDSDAVNAYHLLFKSLSLLPIWHYLLALVILSVVFLYNFFEFHLLEDLFTGFRGTPVSLTYNSASHIYHNVVSKCGILHGRYLATPWLSSSHFQIANLHFFGRPPAIKYRRKFFHTSDGGTIALDWLTPFDVSGDELDINNAIPRDDTTPIVIVVPGLTSDSSSKYLKHLAFKLAKSGCNVVITNHRGLGGVSITSDCFYNAGWTEDIRAIVDFLHQEYYKAPLFAIGTSIGANILVKYLGEDKENVPVSGAVAICNPWDLLIGDRFICRKFLQKLYDRALAFGLQGYAKLHEPQYSRLANWEGIIKSRSIRDFDHYATCLVAKYETVDTYYRRCSSSYYVTNVSVPLLCISALDDPVCTKEAIPWDECRANRNVVLATTRHGGHLAFFEGITASGMWWVRAVDEFLGVLRSSPYKHVQKKTKNTGPHSLLVSSIDQGPYVHITEDGLVAAACDDQTTDDVVEGPGEFQKVVHPRTTETLPTTEQGKSLTEAKSDEIGITQAPNEATNTSSAVSNTVRISLNQIARQNRISIWLLAYTAILSSWPFLRSALTIFFRKKLS